MGNVWHRIATSLLGSPALSVGLRVYLMRLLGFDLSRTTTLWSGGLFGSNRVKTGANVFINVGFFYDGNEALEIMENVRVGPFVRVMTGTHEIGPHHQRCMLDIVSKPVRIEAGSWIGASVTLLPGVVVAEGCVIANNAVVTRSTEPDGLYAGIPAARIRDLPVDKDQKLRVATQHAVTA